MNVTQQIKSKAGGIKTLNTRKRGPIDNGFRITASL